MKWEKWPAKNTAMKHQQDPNPPTNSNIGSFQTVPTASPATWRWFIFPYACKYLSTVTLKRAGEPCIGTEATTEFSSGPGSLHRFHIHTLIPFLLTHCTTGCVKSSWLYSLNRGITGDQTEIGQHKTTRTRLASNQWKLVIALLICILTFLYFSIYQELEKQHKICTSNIRNSSYLFNREVNFKHTEVLITLQMRAHL